MSNLAIKLIRTINSTRIKNFEFIGVLLTKLVIMKLTPEYIQLVTGAVNNKTLYSTCMFLNNYTISHGYCGKTIGSSVFF
jgi:hypothetical protein